MLPTLESNDRFVTEYRNFKERISKITNEKVKTELSEKLTLLLREVRVLDEQHSDMFYKKQTSHFLPDSRKKIIDIRKSIIKKLDDWEKSNS